MSKIKQNLLTHNNWDYNIRRVGIAFFNNLMCINGLSITILQPRWTNGPMSQKNKLLEVLIVFLHCTRFVDIEPFSVDWLAGFCYTHSFWLIFNDCTLFLFANSFLKWYKLTTLNLAITSFRWRKKKLCEWYS